MARERLLRTEKIHFRERVFCLRREEAVGAELGDERSAVALADAKLIGKGGGISRGGGVCGA